jgi:hypothetical protein
MNIRPPKGPRERTPRPGRRMGRGDMGRMDIAGTSRVAGLPPYLKQLEAETVHIIRQECEGYF